MKVKEHLHKYLRVIQDKRKDGSTYVVYKCILPGCTHWLRRELLISRLSICWRCGTEMILNTEALTMKKPRHFECRGRSATQNGE